MTHLTTDRGTYIIPDDVADLLNQYSRYAKDLQRILDNVTQAVHAHSAAVTAYMKNPGYDERKSILLTATVLDAAIDIQIVNEKMKAA